MSSKLSLSLSLTNPPRRVPIEISSDANAANLFEAASKATNIPVQGVKLIFRGRIIANKGSDDDVVVATEFKLEDGCVIHCMGKPSLNLDPSPAAPSASASSTSAGASGSTVVPPASTSTSTSNSNAASATSAPASSTNNDTSSPLKTALLTIKTRHPGPDYKTALTTLSKLLQNVIQNPMEQKYRKVKKSNAAFQKRVGRLTGAEEAIFAMGFQIVGEEYALTPSPEAWPALLEAKGVLDQALRDYEAQQLRSNIGSTATGDMGFGGIPNTGMGGTGGMGMDPNNMSNMMNMMNAMSGAGMGAGNGMGGMPPMPPGMESQISSLLSNPQALQSMLNNPMMQQMLQNHPQFANNPQMQQQMRMLANNPQMLQQMSQMMSDPAMMARMRQMMQGQGGAGMGMGGMGMGGMGGAGTAAPGSTAPPMDMNRQMEMMRQFSNMNNANAGAGTSTSTTGNQNQNQNQSSTNNSGSNNNANANANANGDGQMTEEEMIAAAIARSLREQ